MTDNSYQKGLALTQTCQNVCSNIGVHPCEEKMIGQVKVIAYLGLDIVAANQIIRVRGEKLANAKDALLRLITCKNIRLKELKYVFGLSTLLGYAIALKKYSGR